MISYALAVLVLSINPAARAEDETAAPSAPVEDPFRETRAFCAMEEELESIRLNDLRAARAESLRRARETARARLPELSRVLHSVAGELNLDETSRGAIGDYERQHAGIRAELAGDRGLAHRLTEVTRAHGSRIRGALRAEVIRAIAAGRGVDAATLREWGMVGFGGPVLSIPLTSPRFSSEADLTVLSRDGDRMRVRSEYDMPTSDTGFADSTVVNVVLEEGRVRLKVCNYGGMGIGYGGYGMGFPGMIPATCASRNLSDGTLVGALSAEAAAADQPEVSDELVTASLANNSFFDYDIPREAPSSLCRELADRDHEAASLEADGAAAPAAPATETRGTPLPADPLDVGSGRAF